MREKNRVAKYPLRLPLPRAAYLCTNYVVTLNATTITIHVIIGTANAVTTGIIATISTAITTHIIPS